MADDAKQKALLEVLQEKVRKRIQPTPLAPSAVSPKQATQMFGAPQLAEAFPPEPPREDPFPAETAALMEAIRQYQEMMKSGNVAGAQKVKSSW